SGYEYTVLVSSQGGKGTRAPDRGRLVEDLPGWLPSHLAWKGRLLGHAAFPGSTEGLVCCRPGLRVYGSPNPCRAGGKAASLFGKRSQWFPAHGMPDADIEFEYSFAPRRWEDKQKHQLTASSYGKCHSRNKG